MKVWIRIRTQTAIWYRLLDGLSSAALTLALKRGTTTAKLPTQVEVRSILQRLYLSPPNEYIANGNSSPLFVSDVGNGAADE